jgi:hypothetical protein
MDQTCATCSIGNLWYNACLIGLMSFSCGSINQSQASFIEFWRICISDVSRKRAVAARHGICVCVCALGLAAQVRVQQ